MNSRQQAVRGYNRQPFGSPLTTTGNNSSLSIWNPASLIACVILLTILEGAFRKWVFPTNPILRYGVYFSKDILFLIAGYLGLRRRTLFDTSWLFVCVPLVLLPSAG